MPGEGQADLEGVLGDGEIPELVLEDDRHLLRIFLAQALRNADAGVVGAERDVEMMLPREPVAAASVSTLRTTPLQRVLDQEIVADEVLAACQDRSREKERSGGFCCQVPPNPALRCYPQGL